MGDVTSVDKRELDGACVGQRLGAFAFGYGTHVYIVLNGSLIIFPAPSVMYFYCVKYYVLFNVTLSNDFIFIFNNCLDEPKIL
jgi:hypothetical protein